MSWVTASMRCLCDDNLQVSSDLELVKEIRRLFWEYHSGEGHRPAIRFDERTDLNTPKPEGSE